MIGLRIKHFREHKGFKHEWLANELGISDSQLNRIENGINPITIDRLHQIGEPLNVSIVDLIEEKFLSNDHSTDFDKYGLIEASFIRFLISQNESLRSEIKSQLQINIQLQEQLLALNKNLQKVLAAMTVSNPINNSVNSGGGGVNLHL